MARSHRMTMMLLRIAGCLEMSSSRAMWTTDFLARSSFWRHSLPERGGRSKVREGKEGTEREGGRERGEEGKEGGEGGRERRREGGREGERGRRERWEGGREGGREEGRGRRKGKEGERGGRGRREGERGRREGRREKCKTIFRCTLHKLAYRKWMHSYNRLL